MMTAYVFEDDKKRTFGLFKPDTVLTPVHRLMVTLGEESFSVDKHIFLSVLCENYILRFSLELMQICMHPKTVGTPATLLLDIIL